MCANTRGPRVFIANTWAYVYSSSQANGLRVLLKKTEGSLWNFAREGVFSRHSRWITIQGCRLDQYLFEPVCSRDRGINIRPNQDWWLVFILRRGMSWIWSWPLFTRWTAHISPPHPSSGHPRRRRAHTEPPRQGLVRPFPGPKPWSIWCYTKRGRKQT